MIYRNYNLFQLEVTLKLKMFVLLKIKTTESQRFNNLFHQHNLDCYEILNAVQFLKVK